jgi:transposase
MERYIGIDVHAQSCTVAIVGASGKRLSTEVVETRGESLVKCIRDVPGNRHVCFEEGTQSQWLHELLSPHVIDVIVTMAPENRGNKSDHLDAGALAETARSGKVETRVYKAPSTFAGLRDAARGYQMFCKDATRTKNRIKSVYRSRGQQTPAKEAYRPDCRDEWLKKLPPSSRRLAELLGKQLDAQLAVKEKVEQWLHKEAKRHPAVKLLQSVPGLGPIRAAQIVAVVVTPHRFRSSRQFWGYCGLGIVTRSSADWQRRKNGGWVRAESPQTRGLNPKRNPTLKAIFKGAATNIVTRMVDHPLHQDYQRLVASGTKPNLAKLTLARRIAAISLAIWKKQEEYKPQKRMLPRKNS